MYSFFNLSARWRWVVNGRFTQGMTWYRLHWRLGGPYGRSGRVRIIRPLPRFEPRNFQPVAIRYDRLCGLVVRVSGYRYRGPGFDPRRYQIF